MHDGRQPGTAVRTQAGRIVTLVQLETELARGTSIAAGPGQEAEAAAIAWFVRFHCERLDQFDWAAFEGWIQDQPTHRRAYERIEQLWYEGKTDRQADTQAEVSAAALAELSRSGRVVRLRVAPHAPDQGTVRSHPVLGDDLESEALVERDVARRGGFEPGSAAEPVQSLRPRL